MERVICPSTRDYYHQILDDMEEDDMLVSIVYAAPLELDRQAAEPYEKELSPGVDIVLSVQAARGMPPAEQVPTTPLLIISEFDL